MVAPVGNCRALAAAAASSSQAVVTTTSERILVVGAGEEERAGVMVKQSSGDEQGGGGAEMRSLGAAADHGSLGACSCWDTGKGHLVRCDQIFSTAC